jgi:dTDP-4-amino-4,6-dideoxy-D-galactose acyltransferase
VIERLAWDTNHFGVPIGRVTGSAVSPEDVAEADRLGLRCLYLLVEAADIGLITTAEDLGFRVTDQRITLGRQLSPVTACEPAGSGDARFGAARPAVLADMAALEAVARSAHADSRFFTDPHFDREAAALLYVVWLRNSLAGELADIVLVVEVAGRPVGYITGRVGADRATVTIGLFAIEEAARGRGLGSRLLLAFLAAASQRRTAEATVVTQGANVGAQRLYQAAGFRTTRSELWLHRWASDQG